MNYLRSVRRPRSPRSVSLDDLASDRPGIAEPVARRAALRLLAALRARHAKLCEAPTTSEAFEQLMRAMGKEVAEA